MRLKYLIINADDAGMSPEIDAGILETIHSGAVSSISLLVNPPFQVDPEPFKGSGVSIGLHLNLVIGHPCSSLPVFPGKGIMNTLSYPVIEGKNPQIESSETFCLHEVKEEFFSQLSRFREIMGQDPTHLDVHKHLHRSNIEVFSVVVNMAKELNVPLRCLNSAMRALCSAAGVRTTDHFTGDVLPSPYWTVKRLKEQLAGLPDGITELMCHPGAGMKPMSGLRYVEERDTERETFVSREIKGLLTPFKLVNFRTAF